MQRKLNVNPYPPKATPHSIYRQQIYVPKELVLIRKSLPSFGGSNTQNKRTNRFPDMYTVYVKDSTSHSINQLIGRSCQSCMSAGCQCKLGNLLCEWIPNMCCLIFLFFFVFSFKLSIHLSQTKSKFSSFTWIYLFWFSLKCHPAIGSYIKRAFWLATHIVDKGNSCIQGSWCPNFFLLSHENISLMKKDGVYMIITDYTEMLHIY